MWNIGNVGSLLATNADTLVDVTLSFPCADKLKASRTVTYEIREGSFAAHVRACETNSAAWRKFELPTTFAYNVNWFTGAPNIITYIQWRNLDDPSVPLIGPPSDCWKYTLNNSYGFLPVPDAATLSDTYVFGEGRKRIVWNPMTQFAGRDMRNVSISFRTLEEDVPLGYLVVKIDDGSWWYKPLSFSNEVNTTTYKTTHMAFCYIPATVSSTWLDMTGGVDTFRIGSDGSRKTELGMNDTDVYWERQATIRLTKGFFMGVFPLTRAQYVELGYTLYDVPTNEVPVRGLGYNFLRGDDTAEGYCYPTNRAVLSGSLIGRLRNRTRLDFDLPTEAQWEYAYRAGSTNASASPCRDCKEEAVFSPLESCEFDVFSPLESWEIAIVSPSES